MWQGRVVRRTKPGYECRVKGEFMIDELKKRLPEWHITPYGSGGAVACYPVGHCNSETWNKITRVAFVSSANTVFYVVCRLR